MPSPIGTASVTLPAITIDARRFGGHIILPAYTTSGVGWRTGNVTLPVFTITAYHGEGGAWTKTGSFTLPAFRITAKLVPRTISSISLPGITIAAVGTAAGYITATLAKTLPAYTISATSRFEGTGDIDISLNRSLGFPTLTLFKIEATAFMSSRFTGYVLRHTR
jgi:hypothetical protein